MKITSCVEVGYYPKYSARKILLVMKLLVVLTAVSLQVSANVLAQSVTLSVNNAPLTEVFSAIEKQTGYHFFWRGERIGSARVTVNLKNVSLDEALTQVLDGLPYGHIISKKSIVIRAKEASAASRSNRNQLQQQTVAGRVTDTLGNPLPAVSVQVKGTLITTQTGEDGRFVLQDVPQNAVLVFSFVGYSTREVAAGPNVTVVLHEAISALDEVVVVGYGTVRRSDFTGSAASLSAEDIDKRPVTNVMSTLQGMGPGVQTTMPTGSPGASPTIRIRGIGSYSASNDPLIIVDGVEYNGGMANINPADVENVTVLKDAATIAIYGSRGANGVVMITTKKGQQGRSQLDFQAQFGSNRNGIPRYNTVSPSEFYELMWEAYKNSLIYGNQEIPADIAAQIASGRLPRDANGRQVYNGSTYQDLVQYLGNYNAYNVPVSELISTDGKINPNARLRYEDDLNWEDQASRTGKRNEYSLSYSAGFGKSDLYVSLNYLDEQGWALKSDLDVYRARVNVNSQLTNWLKAGLNLNGNYNKYSNNTFGTGIVNPFYFARQIAPIYPVHVHDPATGEFILDEQGRKIYDLGNLVAQYGLSRPFNSGRHAIAENLWNLNLSTRDFLGGRGYVDVNIRPWLTFNTTMSIDLRNIREEGYDNTIVGDGAPAGRYSQVWSRMMQYTFFQLLRANKQFGDHTLAGTLGHEAVSFRNENISGMRQGQGFENFYTFTNFTDINTLTSGLGEYALESYFLLANYDYKNRYYLSGSVRRDGDSKMPLVNRWSTFWSLGLAWRIDNEPFFHAPWVDLLKLRASYGRLGNNNFGMNNGDFYPYQAGYTIGANNASAPGAVLGALGSPELRWEGQRPFDLGLEFSLFRGRLDGTVEYFNRVSDGLLFDVPQPFHNGGTTGGAFEIARNVGDMRNRGIEVSLTGGLIRKQDFRWDLTVNVMTLKNKVLKMPVETPYITESPYRRQAGYSLYEFYTRKFYGVDPDNGQVLYEGVTVYDPENTNIKLIDRGNGRVDTVTYDHNLARQDWLGKDALADAVGSIVNRFRYKNFDLNFVVLYSIGGWLMDSPYQTFMSSGPSNGQNLHRDLLKGWRKPGDVTDIPRMDLNQTTIFGAMSSRWLTRSDYIGISSVTLSYTLPETVAARIHLKRARVFASTENLYYWTARKGLNSMSNIVGSSPTTSYSPARTLSFGINLGI